MTTEAPRLRQLRDWYPHPELNGDQRFRKLDLAADNQTAAKQIRNILCEGGVKIRRNELSIVSRNRDWIRCAFVLELDAPGVLN